MVVAQLLRSEELEEVALHVRLHEVQILKHNATEVQKGKGGMKWKGKYCNRRLLGFPKRVGTDVTCATLSEQ